MDWGITTRQTQLNSNNYPVGLGIDPSLNLLYPVQLGHQPELILTLSGWIGTSTQALTRTPLSQIRSSTRASTNFARSDWDVDTSHHTPNTTDWNFFFWKKGKEKERGRKIRALLEAALAEAQAWPAPLSMTLNRSQNPRQRCLTLLSRRA